MAEPGTIERAYADGYAAARDEIERLRAVVRDLLMEFFVGKISLPDSSVFTVRNGDLIIEMRGKLFPKAGGAECGNSMTTFNLSDHIRDLIADALNRNKD